MKMFKYLYYYLIVINMAKLTPQERWERKEKMYKGLSANAQEKYKALKGALEAATYGSESGVERWLSTAQQYSSVPIPQRIAKIIRDKLAGLYPFQHFVTYNVINAEGGVEGVRGLRVVPVCLFHEGMSSQVRRAAQIAAIRETYLELAKKIPGLPVPTDVAIKNLYGPLIN